MNFKLTFFIIFLNLFVFSTNAQDGTKKKSKEAFIPTGKILLIPFEPNLYMSEIDQKINQQTNWKFDRIRENFRHQLDIQLKNKLNKIAPTVSFYSDSLKMAKDLANIYKSSTLSYDLLEKPTGKTPPPIKQDGIKNGQLTVEINTDKKFMNKKLNDTELINYLYKKYKTDYFVFINELDLKSDPDSYNMATDSYQREVTVHYSIIDKNSKTMDAGIATSKFNSKENNPKKIVALSFSPIASFISSKLSTVIASKKENTPKK